MLKNIYTFKLKIELLSGMHITGSDDTFDIGGADAQVIKNPLSKEPYIPGSSLKGKLRSLLEYTYGSVIETSKGKKLEIQEKNQICLSLFEPRKENKPMITRGIFRDLVLTEECKKELEMILGEGIYTEIKAENRIDRFKGTAQDPRFIERVPAGAIFEGTINILEFDDDNYAELERYLRKAVELLEVNYIGGSGSRGYGQVKVTLDEINVVKVSDETVSPAI